MQQPVQWAQKAIMNVAMSGKFSSDRTISEYAKEIWDCEVNYNKLPNPHEVAPTQ
jgi:glycogen phosphorylase